MMDSIQRVGRVDDIYLQKRLRSFLSYPLPRWHGAAGGKTKLSI